MFIHATGLFHIGIIGGLGNRRGSTGGLSNRWEWGESPGGVAYRFESGGGGLTLVNREPSFFTSCVLTSTSSVSHSSSSSWSSLHTSPSIPTVVSYSKTSHRSSNVTFLRDLRELRRARLTYLPALALRAIRLFLRATVLPRREISRPELVREMPDVSVPVETREVRGDGDDLGPNRRLDTSEERVGDGALADERRGDLLGDVGVLTSLVVVFAGMSV
jgi:hypothetical protein